MTHVRNWLLSNARVSLIASSCGIVVRSALMALTAQLLSTLQRDIVFVSVSTDVCSSERALLLPHLVASLVDRVPGPQMPAHLK